MNCLTLLSAAVAAAAPKSSATWQWRHTIRPEYLFAPSLSSGPSDSFIYLFLPLPPPPHLPHPVRSPSASGCNIILKQIDLSCFCPLPSSMIGPICWQSWSIVPQVSLIFIYKKKVYHSDSFSSAALTLGRSCVAVDEFKKMSTSWGKHTALITWWQTSPRRQSSLFVWTDWGQSELRLCPLLP